VTVSSPNVIEIKLDRLIDDMRLLRSQMIAFDRHLKERQRDCDLRVNLYTRPKYTSPISR
jgi:hypothetical protein